MSYECIPTPPRRHPPLPLPLPPLSLTLGSLVLVMLVRVLRASSSSQRRVGCDRPVFLLKGEMGGGENIPPSSQEDVTTVKSAMIEAVEVR